MIAQNSTPSLVGSQHLLNSENLTQYSKYVIIVLSYNKHKVICEHRLYINLCTQMKTILTGLPMYGYLPGRVFVYVGGIEVRWECVCVCGVYVCVCVWCRCVLWCV